MRALRKGWIKRDKEEPKEPEMYLMWADDGNVADSTASGMFTSSSIFCYVATQACTGL